MSDVGVAWQPEPGWQPAPGGLGGGRVFWAERAGRPVAVKRLDAPVAGDPAALSEPSSYAYWRREADVALDGSLATTPGIAAAPVIAVELDATGATLVTERVEPADNPGLLLALALGRFATASLESRPWWTRHQLADRLARVEERGGWPTLQRTTLADVADRLWSRRSHHLARLGSLSQVTAHGDPSPANLPGRDGEVVVGIDWSTFGSAAVGADVGYLALSVREDFDVLLDAYAEGAGVARAAAYVGASVTACYTAISRTEWVLARAAATPGALAGKYRHPTVAPYLRQLQRLFPQLETLL